MKLKPRHLLATLALSISMWGMPVMALEKAGVSKQPSPNIQVLIMAIGAYKNGVTPLNGVQFDVETATQIAKKMGAMDNNIRVYRDDQLTLDGMRKAFDDLDARVHQDDQVLIYYSGHGGRQKLNDPILGERCAAAFITVDGDGFMDAEVKEKLRHLSEKAQKLIVMIDACHSGGIATRALNDSNPEFTPKFWFKGGAGDTCARPVNIVTRSINADLKKVGSGANNYTYIAAARENEISLDQPGKGGVASQAWLQCMNGDAQDLDGSGDISAEEIRVCAQEKIDAKLSKAKSVRPHHVTITGNSELTMGFMEKAVTAPSMPPSTVSATSASPAPTVSPNKPATATVKANPLATLTSIYSNRDDKRVVEFKAAKPKLTIDKDIFDFTLKSSHDGYVYLLMVGSDGHSFDLLFPNQLDHKNEIRAGETLKLPRATWELGVQGPPGKDTLLAIVAESPRNFSQIGMQPSGPFSSIDAQTSPGSGRDMQMASGNSANANSEECLMPKTRNITIRKRCSPAYGAALITVEEIK